MKLFRKTRDQVDSFSLRAFVISEEDEEYFCLQVELLINNYTGVGLPVDLCELQKAIDSDGNFFVWTCDCGTPGCAGRFKGIQFTHSNEFIMFKDLDCRESEEFRFESKAVRSSFELALKQGKKLAAGFLENKLVSIPDQNRKFFDTSSFFQCEISCNSDLSSPF
jgi:hypothetical protein